MTMDIHILLPLLLVPAKILGTVASRFGIPAVFGEIVAGFLLGPAVMGFLPADTNGSDGYHIFQEFAQVGLCVLLFRIGLETDPKEFLRVWRSATGVAVAGMVVPFSLGFAVGIALGWSTMVAAFIGATLTATSIGVTAAVMDELGVQSSPEGRIMMGAAVLDDIMGLILLGTAVSLATAGESVFSQVIKGIVQAIAFIAGGVFLGPWLVELFMRVSKWSGNSSMLLVLAVAYLTAMAWTAHAIGLAMVIGAYAAGWAFGGHPEHDRLNENLRPIIDLITPLFFILIGASIELEGFNLLEPEGRAMIAAFVLLLGAASIGKLLSPFFVDCGSANRLAIGSGMMPRGEVGLVFAQVGLSVSLFNKVQYSVLTLVIVVTTVMGPVMLRMLWPRGTHTSVGKATVRA